MADAHPTENPMASALDRASTIIEQQRAQIERLRRERDEAVGACRIQNQGVLNWRMDYERLRAALEQIADESVIQGMTPRLFAQLVLRGSDSAGDEK